MKIKKKVVESYLQIREVEGHEDDYTNNFADTKGNASKLLRFIELYDEIKPNGHRPKQLWRVQVERLTK